MKWREKGGDDGMERKEGGMFLTVAILTVSVMFIGLVMSAAASTIWLGNISAPSDDYSAPIPITVPENITELRVTADTSDFQIDIHLYDPNGRHTGATYPTGEETEIPQSSYSGWNTDPEVISVMNPAPGTYTVKAYGYHKTGWADVTVTMTTALIGNVSYIRGKVLDQSLFPVEGVNVSVRDNVTLELYGWARTNSTGWFNVSIQPPSYPVIVDIHFEKECYGPRDEMGLLVPHPGWVSDPMTIYMTEKEKTRLNVIAVPSEINATEITTLRIEVRDEMNRPVKGANVTLIGAGVNKGPITTPDNGTIYVDVTPTSEGEIKIKATKTCYYDGETTVIVRPPPPSKVGVLTVFVYDYVSGKLVGTFDKSYTYEGVVHTCRVPDVYVEVKDADTGEIINSSMTHNGSVNIIIPLEDSERRVNIYANINTSLQWYMADATTPPWYVHWIEPGHEEGVIVFEGYKTPLVTMYVGVREPDPQILVVNATPQNIRKGETTTVTIRVTGYIEGYREKTERPIPNASVTLTGAGVHIGPILTDDDGIVSVDVTPTRNETIYVSAKKDEKDCYVSGSCEIEVGKEPPKPIVLIVYPVDAQNTDRSIGPTTVEVWDTYGNWLCSVTDEGPLDKAAGEPGKIAIADGTGELEVGEGIEVNIIVTYGVYNPYTEHGIVLRRDIQKEITVEMTRS